MQCSAPTVIKTLICGMEKMNEVQTEVPCLHQMIKRLVWINNHSGSGKLIEINQISREGSEDILKAAQFVISIPALVENDLPDEHIRRL